MPTSPEGLRYPALGAAPNVPSDMGLLVTDLGPAIIPEYANATARDAALTSPAEGRQCKVAGVPQIRKSSRWVPLTTRVEAITRSYGTGAPVSTGTTWTDSTPLSISGLVVGQIVVVTLSYDVRVDTANMTVQTATPGVVLTGLTQVNGILPQERLPTPASDTSWTTYHRHLVLTASATSGSIAVRVTCGTGAHRLLVMSAAVIATVHP